jgi:hypothetical protein
MRNEMIENILVMILVGNLILAGVMYVMAYKHGYKDGVSDTNKPF